MRQRFVFFDKPWKDSEYAVEFWFHRHSSVVKEDGKFLEYIDGIVNTYDVAKETGVSESSARRGIRTLEDTFLNHVEDSKSVTNIDMGKFDSLNYDTKSDRTHWVNKFDEGWRYAAIDGKKYMEIYDLFSGDKNLVMYLRVYAACKSRMDLAGGKYWPDVTNKALCKDLGVNDHSTKAKAVGDVMEGLQSEKLIRYDYKFARTCKNKDVRFRKLLKIY